MRLATLKLDANEVPAVVIDTGLICVEIISREFNKNWSKTC